MGPNRGVAKGGEWCGRPGRQNPRGRKMNILNSKKAFRALSEVKAIEYVIAIFKGHNLFCVGGGGRLHCDYSSPAPKSRAVFLNPLFSNTFSLCSSFNVRNQVSRTYNMLGNITVLSMLIINVFR